MKRKQLQLTCSNKTRRTIFHILFTFRSFSKLFTKIKKKSVRKSKYFKTIMTILFIHDLYFECHFRMVHLVLTFLIFFLLIKLEYQVIIRAFKTAID